MQKEIGDMRKITFKMMWMILQADQPEDWVIATGQTTTVRDFVKLSFAYTGINLKI